MAKYVIWDKKSDVITPKGEVLSAEQWIARRPVAAVLPTVLSGSAVNGGFFGIYADMVNYYADLGCDFSACETEREHLDAIEAFEKASNASGETVSDATRTADALEDLVMLQELQMDGAE